MGDSTAAVGQPTTSIYPFENGGPTILGATLTVTVFALLTLIVRLYVRIRMIKNLGWDDYIMIVAMMLVGWSPKLSVRDTADIYVVCSGTNHHYS